MAAGKIFINYRREDSRADAGRLYDRLHALYPTKVFRDVGSLEPGIEWRDAINKVLADSDACMVVIGKNWLTVTDAQGKPRLDDPRDTVREELRTALKSGIRVFPILVGGAKMPAEEDLPEELQALARRNALELSEQDWNEDFDKLVQALERALGWSAPKPRKGSSTAILAAAGAFAGLCAIAIGAAVFSGVWPKPASPALESPAPALELDKTPPPQETVSSRPPPPPPPKDTAPRTPAPRVPPIVPARGAEPLAPRIPEPLPPRPSMVENTAGTSAGRVAEPRDDSTHVVRLQVVHRHGFNHRVARCEGWLTIERNGTVSYECDQRFLYDNRCDRVTFPSGSFTFTAEDTDHLHLSTPKGNFDFFAQQPTIAAAVRALGVVKAREPPKEEEEPEEREEPEPAKEKP